jgi:CRISPR-associated endoribonuclease Cas6
MNRIDVYFKSNQNGIDGSQITAMGIHGLLFNTLKRFSASEVEWLHRHPIPKPVSIVPLYSQVGYLEGLRLTSLSERASILINNSWNMMFDQETALHLGEQNFRIVGIEKVALPAWREVTRYSTNEFVKLRFLSPTSFKSDSTLSLFPLPDKVFGWLYRVWQSYAPEDLRAPAEWLVWCNRNIQVTEHNIRTVQVAMRQREIYTGFVGDAVFEALDHDLMGLHYFNAFSNLAPISGVGRKTMMGMGVVDKISIDNEKKGY